MGLLKGAKIIGNHYSDYDEPGEGCNDTNSDGFCDEPRTIGKAGDRRASAGRSHNSWSKGIFIYLLMMKQYR